MTNTVPRDVKLQAIEFARAIRRAPDFKAASIIERAILAERTSTIAKIDEEIERARELGPHHIPVLSAVKRAIRGEE